MICEPALVLDCRARDVDHLDPAVIRPAFQQAGGMAQSLPGSRPHGVVRFIQGLMIGRDVKGE